MKTKHKTIRTPVLRVTGWVAATSKDDRLWICTTALDEIKGYKWTCRMETEQTPFRLEISTKKTRGAKRVYLFFSAGIVESPRVCYSWTQENCYGHKLYHALRDWIEKRFKKRLTKDPKPFYVRIREQVRK